MSDQWGPDLRHRPEPARPDVVMRHGDESHRERAYFGATGAVPVIDDDQPRTDVTNPRRDDRRRGRAYTNDLEGEL